MNEEKPRVSSAKELNAKFNKVLGKVDIFTLSFGAMIGWGWVVLSGGWVLKAGVAGAVLGFLIGGIVVALVSLTYAELTSAMPKVGGELVFSFRGLGLNTSFITTWLIIMGYVAICAFEAVAFPVVMENLVPLSQGNPLWYINDKPIFLNWIVIGILGSLAMGIINVIGMKSAAVFQTTLTILMILVGFMLLLGSIFSNQTALPTNEVWDTGKISIGILSVIIMTPFMLVGFDVIPQAAEEINLPYNLIGRVLMLSVLMAILWYIAIIYSVGNTLTTNEIQSNMLAPATAMEKIFNGRWARQLLILAGLAGVVTSWNSFLIGSARVIYAMANAGMLPGVFAVMHLKYKTPVNAIAFITLISIVAPFFGKEALTWLANAGGFGIVASWSLVSLAFYQLRRKEPKMNRPFKIAYGRPVGILSFVLSLLLLVLYLPGSPSSLNTIEWSIVACWLFLGAVFYFWAGKTNGRASMKSKMEQQIRN